MSGPSFENIDRWLFEYVEGNLSPEQVKQLEAFLLDHPEFDMDLDSWQMAKVEPLFFEFPNQDSLYRKEKKRRRILPYFIGFSAITTLAAFSVFLLFNSEDTNSEIGLNVFTLTNQTKNSAKNQRDEVNSRSKNTQNKSSITLGLNNSAFSKNTSKTLGIPAEHNGNFLPNLQDVVSNNSRIQPVNKSQEKTHEEITLDQSQSLSQQFINTNSNELLLVSKDSLSRDSVMVVEISEKENIVQPSSQSDSKKAENKKSSNSTKRTSKWSFKQIINNLNHFMGDEIGLKNTRDHQIHVPGLSQLDANFSSAGDVSSTRFRSITRAQWLGKENQTFTNQLALDWFSKSIKSGFGIQGNYQLYGNGVIQNWNLACIYSPKILIAKSVLIEPGIRFKMGSKVLKSNLIINTDRIELDRGNSIDFYSDGSIPIGTNQWYRDLGTSLLIHSKWFYLGAQVDNLLRHQDNIYSNSISNPRRAGMHFSVNLGTEYESKTGDLSFSPYGYYEKFENREEAWGGFNFQYKVWSIGGAVSNKSNFALSTGLRFSTFAITYQFDQTFSNLLGSTASSHQLSIMFNTKVSRTSRRYIQLK
jgi:hypothetical protein